MISALAFVVLTATPDVELVRKFTKGEKLAYQVRSHLLLERSSYQFPIGIPNELDINYDSTMLVKDVKADGFASVEYRRPTITEIEGETAESPPKSKTEKVDFNLTMTLSPINEVTEMSKIEDPKTKKGGGGGGGGLLLADLPVGLAPKARQAALSFVTDLYRLALCIGSLDSSLEFNPKLPLDEVKVGDTWKRTVSYQPQALKGEGGKQAVQRLDLTYRYDGPMQVKGKNIERVSASLSLDTDAADFVNKSMGTTSSKSGLKALKLKINSTIIFDLEPKTLKTLSAKADTKGSWTMFVIQLGDQPAVEEKITGNSTLALVGQ